MGYNVPVWALIGYLHAADGDVARVAADYDLPEAGVAAAHNYYRQHRAQIDARIAANAAPQDHAGIRVSNTNQLLVADFHLDHSDSPLANT